MKTSQVDYWRSIWQRFRLPATGTWLIAPDDYAPGCFLVVHAETKRDLPVKLCPGETVEQMRDTFAAAVPTASFLLPS